MIVTDSSNFTLFEAGEDLEILKRHLKDAYPNLDINDCKEDRRHKEFSIFTAHSCMAFSVLTHGAAAEGSFFQNRIIKSLAVYLALPCAHIADGVIDLPLALIQALYFAKKTVSLVGVFFINKILRSDSQIAYIPYKTTALKTFYLSIRSFTYSVEHLFSYPILSWGDMLGTSVSVYNEKISGFEEMIDKNKIEWIQKKFPDLKFIDEDFKQSSEDIFLREKLVIKGGNDRPVDISFISYEIDEDKNWVFLYECKKTWKISKHYPISGVIEWEGVVNKHAFRPIALNIENTTSNK